MAAPTNRILADILLRGGQKLLQMAVDQTVLKPRKTPEVAEAAKAAPKKRGSVVGKFAGAAAIRIATKSVPGAIVIGGGLIAKTLYDRQKASKSASGQAKKNA